MPLHSASKNQMPTGVMSPVFTVAVCDAFPAVVFPAALLPAVPFPAVLLPAVPLPFPAVLLPAAPFPVVPLPGVVVPDEVPASNTSAYAENLSVAKVMVPLAASYVAGSFS